MAYIAWGVTTAAGRKTPFGRPVVPEVYIIWLPSTGSVMSEPSSGARAAS